MSTTALDTAPAPRRWWFPGYPIGLTEGRDGELYWDGPDPMSRDAVEQTVIRASDAAYNGLYRLHELVRIGVVDLADPAMAGIVASTWLVARSRYDASTYSTETRLTRARAVELFRLNGYTVNCLPADRPTGPVRVYRGCGEGIVHLDHLGRPVPVDAAGQPDPDTEISETYPARLGLTWTTNRSQAAQWSKSCLRAAGLVRVWSTEVDSAYLLAALGPEVVIDPAGLDLSQIAVPKR